jgi:hypothetical protein
MPTIDPSTPLAAPPPPATPPAARRDWGLWAAVGALAVAIAAIWFAEKASTNSRIDQIYPLIVQQTKDIDGISSQLQLSSGKIEAAEGKITAAAARVETISNQLSDLTQKQAGLIARQEDQTTNIQEIKKAIFDLSSSVSTQLNNMQEKINSSPRLPLRKTEFLSGSFVFAPEDVSKDWADAVKAAGVREVVDIKHPADFAKILGSWKEQNYGGNLIFLTKDADIAKSITKALGEQK